MSVGPSESPAFTPKAARTSLIRATIAASLSGVLIGDIPSPYVQHPHCVTQSSSRDFQDRLELQDIEAGIDLVGKTFTVSYPELNSCPKIIVRFIRDRGTNEIGIEVNGKTFINENCIESFIPLVKDIPATSLVDKIVTLEKGDISVVATNYGHANISHEQFKDLLLQLLESKESRMDIETDVKFVAETQALQALATAVGLNAEKKIVKVRRINPKRLALMQR